MKRKTFITAIVFCCSIAFINAVEMSRGDMVVELPESTGRFSVYAVGNDGRKIPLLLAEDPRTTVLSVLADNRVYRMGESFEFRARVATTSSGAEVVWSSSKLQVRQEFSFPTTKSLLITIVLENESESSLSIGARYLLDTYLGESSGHFTVNGKGVTTERSYSATIPRYIRSAGNTDPALYIVTNSADVTVPNEIVLANWKRISDATWSYATNTGRNYNLLPYSINDSAVALYYEPATVSRGSSRTIRILLSIKAPEEPAAGTTDTRTSTSAPAAASSSSTGGTVAGSGGQIEPEAEISAIDVLLNRINNLLASPDGVDTSQINALKESVENLKTRKEQYERE